jgi:signal transduction histidine kinase
MGIPEEKLTPQAAGRGVGLPGTQERVRQHFGKMEIQSKGKGTTVKVSLPLLEQ